MKLSFNWLNQYIDITEFKNKPEDLGQKLTNVGLEIEGIDNQSKAWQHIVVAKIISKKAHPNADKLSLCQVDTGSETVSIVCGAKNHKQGDCVVAALPGATLPGDFTIKKSKLRGEDSFGMLCSESELGLETSMDGILILDSNAKVGSLWSEHNNLNDSIFDVNVTPNRADCLSHFGIARELSCVLNKKLKKDFSKIEVKNTFSEFSINIAADNKKLGYSACVIKNVTVAESPSWLKERLASVGAKSINNIVDITNFVMWELGQPMHAFDLKKINKAIYIRLAKKSETLMTLDNKNIEFKGDELIIADAVNPLALAGVIGGLDSGVNLNSKDIFIESAYFESAGVRRASKAFGIQTESSDRFSKSTDPDNLLKALKRACELISQLAGGEVQENIFYHKAPVTENKTIIITKSFLEDKLGYTVDIKDFDQKMLSLFCQLKILKSEEREVIAPAFRKDLDQAVDLVEEYARLNGYDKIPEILPVFSDTPSQHNTDYLKNKKLTTLCKNAGFFQAINYHFTNSKFQNTFLGDKKGLKKYSSFIEGEVPVLNPLSSDLNVMRLSLLPDLFKNVLYNYKHNQQLGNLFELGSVFNKEDKAYKENHFISFISWGNKNTLWEKNQTALVFQLKGRVESLLKNLNLSFSWQTITDTNLCPNFLHPKRALALQLRGQWVGYLGEVHPSLLQKHKIRSTMALAEFNTEFFNFNTVTCKFSALSSKYPTVTRDLSVLCPKDLLSEKISQSIKKTVGKDLLSCSVLDIYEPKNTDKVSISFRLLLQNAEKTYSEDDLQELQTNIFKNLSKNLGVTVPLK